jgi:hypothetical protein
MKTEEKYSVRLFIASVCSMGEIGLTIQFFRRRTDAFFVVRLLQLMKGRGELFEKSSPAKSAVFKY